MVHVILDTNFILSCIAKKIDFFNLIPGMGMKIIIPLQVMDELKKISRQGRGKFKDNAKLALAMLEKNKFGRMDLYNKNADNGIVKIAEKNPSYVIATLDRELKSRIKNHKLVIRGNKGLEIM